MLNYLMIVVLTLFIPAVSRSVEIPLDKQTNAVTQGNASTDKTSLGYVDIDRVFAEHPMTKRLKDEFSAAADKKKKEVADLQMQITGYEQLIVSSTTMLNKAKGDLVILKNLSDKKVTSSTSAPVAVSTSVPKELPLMIADKEKTIVNIQKDIDSFGITAGIKRQDLVKLVDKQKDSLTKLEETETNAVLSDIYTVFESVAEEEGVTIIVDKSQVLYGKSVKDLTDKVLERLRGR